MTNILKPVCFLLLSLFSTVIVSAGTLPGTIIIPASDFLDEIPKGNIITDAGTQQTSWLFNNTGIVLNFATNLMTQVTVPDDGIY